MLLWTPVIDGQCHAFLGRRSFAAGTGADRAAAREWHAVALEIRNPWTFPRRQIAALFVLFAGIAAIPILSHPLPPLSDYVNHLSRMHVIAAIGNDPDLARFYQVDWQVIPNLMMDMVLPVLVRVMSIYAAGQAYMIASFVLILSGTFALNRQLHGRWSVLPLAAFPLLYNYVFLVGTMNYVSGIGVSLWALVTWIGLRERNLLLRLTVSTLFVAALFFCHLFALGTYGLGLLAFELHRLWLSDRGRTGQRPAGAAARRCLRGCSILSPPACRSCRCCRC